MLVWGRVDWECSGVGSRNGHAESLLSVTEASKGVLQFRCWKAVSDRMCRFEAVRHSPIRPSNLRTVFRG